VDDEVGTEMQVDEESNIFSIFQRENGPLENGLEQFTWRRVVTVVRA
jgi:hypothetical protein